MKLVKTKNPLMALHLRNFPRALLNEVKNKATEQCKTKQQFIIDALVAATGTNLVFLPPSRKPYTRKTKSQKRKKRAR